MNTKENITLIINGQEKEYPYGTTYGDVAKEYAGDYKYPIAVANHNLHYQELFQTIEENGELEFLDLSSATGHQTYMRTATLLFVKAVNDVLGMAKIDRLKLEFSMNTGYFFSYEGSERIDEEVISKITARMQEMVDSDLKLNIYMGKEMEMKKIEYMILMMNI